MLENMNFEIVLTNIYELINKGIKIWIDNQNIKLSIPDNVSFSDTDKAFIKLNKAKIINYLKDNKVYSEQSLLILKSKLNKSLLSFSQERLWFIEQYEEGTNINNISLVFKVSEEAKLDLIQKSIKSIVSRHEILRTLINSDLNGNNYQLVYDDGEYPLEILTFDVKDQAELDQELTKEVNHVYDLLNEYPIRARLYKLQSTQNYYNYYLSIVIHHIAFDEWSSNIFLAEFQEYYNYYYGKSNGLKPILNLPKLSIQYKDFAFWQRCYLRGDKLNKQLNYWKYKLYDYQTINLPTDKPRPKRLEYLGSNIHFKLDKDTSNSLRKLAKEMNISLYSLLLAGYYLMLRSYSNQDDLVLGVPVANRHYSQTENLIGFFVNTLALRIKINSHESIKEFIQRVAEEVVLAQYNQDLPFEKLVDELKLVKDNSRHPIFQIMFGTGSSKSKNLKNQQSDTNLLEIYKSESSFYNTAKFDITTFVNENEDCINGIFNYSVSLFTKRTINEFIKTFKEILKQFVSLVDNNDNDKKNKIANLNYFNLKEYKKVIKKWNETDKVYPDNKTIYQLFEEQVEKTPDNVAVVYENNSLTYKELNQEANQLANYLIQNYSIKPDKPILLFLNRSNHMLIAILASLKAGGCYVPIDPNYPNDRISYIIKNANGSVVLTNKIYQKRLEYICSTRNNQSKSYNSEEEQALEIISLEDELLKKELTVQSKTNLNISIISSNLVYIIYTSGTTGKPKGVMIEHRSLVNRIKWMNDTLPLKETDRILQKTSYAFDVSVWELLWANCYGACLVFAKPEKHRDADYLVNLIAQELITIVHFVPSMLDIFENSLKAKTKELNYILYNLKHIFCSGEALNLNQVQKCSSTLPNTKLYNLYGPTETSIDVLYYNCTNRNKNIKTIYLGKPINNTIVYSLNDDLVPVPVGAIGELYIGGIGLARGYLNQPGLTAERFIANPYVTDKEVLKKKNLRLYKTGDLVRWLPDGNLEYVGRNDFQVKIRGYRIELEEIENVLSNYPGIKQNVILAKDQINTEGELTGNKYLVGYYVSEDKLNEEDILYYLQSKLPDYMLPTTLVYLDKLPLTLNGKLDRKALPDPKFTNEDSYVAPRNDLEREMCTIWAEVLCLPQNEISITDDFFKLGGDSIVSIQLVGRLRQRLKLNINIKDIFSYKTISKLYNNVVVNQISINDSILESKSEQGLLTGELALLPIQEWFFASKYAQENHWNQSFLIKAPELNIEKLKTSILKLVDRHDSFRIKYKRNDNNKIIAYYDKHAYVEELKILDIRTLRSSNKKSDEVNEKLQTILTKWQSEFNIEKGPLYSVGYLYGYEDGSSRLYFALHHLIVDVVSWKILVDDLKNLYNDNNTEIFKTKGSSYRQWVEVVKNYATNNEEEKRYWYNVLADYDDMSNKPLDNLKVRDDTRNCTNIELGKELTQKLLKESNKAYNTQINDLLLTALGYTLYEITGNKVNHIVLEGHGREEIDSNIDITRTIGWFTTMYPVRLEVNENNYGISKNRSIIDELEDKIKYNKEDLGNTIKHIKETLRQIPNKGIGYGSLLGYRKESPNLPRISFNYLGQFDDINQKKAKDTSWQITDEVSGIAINHDNYDYNIININGLVINGILKFDIATKFDQHTTNKLANIFKKILHIIIKYCFEKKSTKYTMSDFEDFEPYIIISQQSKNRLFIFPPGAGGIETYLNNIVLNLQDITLVLFNNYYSYLNKKFSKNYITEISYENLAREYICYIKVIQPHGPYNFFGWSFGGILAFEIALQLMNEGAVVNNLVLVDSYFNYKNVVLETGGKLLMTDINYQYLPKLDNKNFNAKVILFKALEVTEPELRSTYRNSQEQREIKKICEYYAKNSKYNNLDQLLNNTKFKVEFMNCSHYSWINDKIQIMKICEEIKNIFKK